MDIIEPKSKLKWEKFSHHFPGDWKDVIKPGFDAGLLDAPYAAAKALKARGRLCTPEPDVVFRALKETRLRDVRCVLVGLSPYHTEKDGRPIADGLNIR